MSTITYVFREEDVPIIERALEKYLDHLFCRRFRWLGYAFSMTTLRGPRSRVAILDDPEWSDACRLLVTLSEEDTP